MVKQMRGYFCEHDSLIGGFYLAKWSDVRIDCSTPPKAAISKGKACLPTTIFQGTFGEFWGSACHFFISKGF